MNDCFFWSLINRDYFTAKPPLVRYACQGGVKDMTQRCPMHAQAVNITFIVQVRILNLHDGATRLGVPMQGINSVPKRLHVRQASESRQNAQSRWLQQDACAHGSQCRGALNQRYFVTLAIQKCGGSKPGSARTNDGNPLIFHLKIMSAMPATTIAQVKSCAMAFALVYVFEAKHIAKTLFIAPWKATGRRKRISLFEGAKKPVPNGQVTKVVLVHV